MPYSQYNRNWCSCTGGGGGGQDRADRELSPEPTPMSHLHPRFLLPSLTVTVTRRPNHVRGWGGGLAGSRGEGGLAPPPPPPTPGDAELLSRTLDMGFVRRCQRPLGTRAVGLSNRPHRPSATPTPAQAEGPGRQGARCGKGMPETTSKSGLQAKAVWQCVRLPGVIARLCSVGRARYNRRVKPKQKQKIRG